MEKKKSAYFKLFSFLFLVVCVCIILVSQLMADDLKFYSKNDRKIQELCKSVEEPSDYSKRVESKIIGKWIYTYVPGYSDSLPNIQWQTLNFKKEGVVEYSYELKSKKKIVKKRGTYKFYHQGSPRKFPGRAPNIMVKDKNPLKAKNIIPFIDVKVGLDNRFPMPGGKVLKFKDIDGKQHIFVRQEEAPKKLRKDLTKYEAIDIAKKAINDEDIDLDAYYLKSIKEFKRDGKEVWFITFDSTEKLQQIKERRPIKAGGEIFVHVDKKTGEAAIGYGE